MDAKMLRMLRLSPEDILEGLRIAGVPKIDDVRYAIIETNGQLSVIPRADRQPLTPSDIRLHPDEAGIAQVLVSDGKVIQHNLKQLDKDEQWLLRQCRRRGISSLSEVFLLTLDDQGNLFIQKNKQEGGI